MNAESSAPANDELRPEYDESVLRGGVRGKYAERYAAHTNLVRLDPDVAAVFTNDETVNQALRLLARLAADTAQLTGRSE